MQYNNERTFSLISLNIPQNPANEAENFKQTLIDLPR